MTHHAHVAVRTTAVALAVLLAVVAAKYVVQTAKEKPAALVKPGPAGSAVPQCNGCKREREKEGRSPRDLVRLPLGITQNKAFHNRGKPLYLCTHCDGGALEDANKAHKKREEAS